MFDTATLEYTQIKMLSFVSSKKDECRYSAPDMFFSFTFKQW